MNNAFDGLMSRLDMAEKRISDLEGISLEISKTEKQRKKDCKQTKPPEYLRTAGQLQKV